LTTTDATRASIVVVVGGWWLMPLPLNCLLLEKKTIKIQMDGKKTTYRGCDGQEMRASDDLMGQRTRCS
jgi:hypothetical protein